MREKIEKIIQTYYQNNGNVSQTAKSLKYPRYAVSVAIEMQKEIENLKKKNEILIKNLERERKQKKNILIAYIATTIAFIAIAGLLALR